MSIRRPHWFYAATVSNLLAFACFIGSTQFSEVGASKAMMCGLGFAVAGIYMFVVSCRPYKENKE